MCSLTYRPAATPREQCVPLGPYRPHLEGNAMGFVLSVGPVMALIAGILILIMPRLLNYIVAVYLILIGLFGLFGGGGGNYTHL
jgi:hypothetical protein